MKKIVISITLGALLLGLLTWAGLTHLFGSGTESVLTDSTMATSEADEIEFLKVVPGDYERGFLSSNHSTHIGLPNNDADGDGRPDNALILDHQIFHGPIAFTPDGPVPCSAYVITTLQLDSLPPETQEFIAEGFLGKAPLVIKTRTGLGSELTSNLTVSPFRVEDEQAGTEFAHAGITAALHFVGGQDDKLDQFSANATLGGWRMVSEAIEINAAQGSGTFSFINEENMQGKISLGEVTFDGGDGAMAGRIGEIHLTIDQARASEKLPVFLGENRLDFEGLSFSMTGQEFAIKDGLIMGKSGVEDGKMYGLLRYGFGELTIPPEIAGPALPFMGAFEKGIALELGARGIDLAEIENLVETGQEMQQIQLRELSAGNPSDEDSLMALPEYQEATSAMINDMVDLIQPGIQLYTKYELNGRTGNSVAEIKLGMGGDRKLRELDTLGAVLNAVTAEASLNIHKGDLPPDELAMMVESVAEGGFINDTPDAITGNAELVRGGIVINGEEMPLLESLELPLDDPIPWDMFLSPEMLMMGAGAGGLPMEVDALPEMEDAPEEGDDEKDN